MNTNFKIYKESEKAIETAWIFKDAEGKEFLHLAWIPKSMIRKDGNINKSFADKKLFEIRCKYYYDIEFLGIETADCTVEREIRDGAKRRISYKVYAETEKAVLLRYILTLYNDKEIERKEWVPKSCIDEFGLKEWFAVQKTVELKQLYNYGIKFIEIEEAEAEITAEAALVV